MHFEMSRQMGLVGMDAIVVNEWLILHTVYIYINIDSVSFNLQPATNIRTASRLAERPWHWQCLARTWQLPAATEVPLRIQLGNTEKRLRQFEEMIRTDDGLKISASLPVNLH